MDWKKLLLNIGGSAAAAVGAVLTAGASGAPVDGHSILAAAGAAVVANIFGLFQKQPQK